MRQPPRECALGLVLAAYCLLPHCSLTWCPRRDSNPEPTDYESAALTVELQGHKDLQLLLVNCGGNCGYFVIRRPSLRA